MAVRGIKWPGRANLVVSLLSLYKGDHKGLKVLDGRTVSVITGLLEDSVDLGPPAVLNEQAGRGYMGSVLKGDGFLLTHQDASELKEDSIANSEVVFKIINGDEINSDPAQQASRSVVCFHNWPEEKAQNYQEPYDHVVRYAKPDRMMYDENKNSENRKLKEKWWLFGRYSPDLYAQIKNTDRCFVAAATTKHLSFSAVATDQIFTHALFVLAQNRWDIFSIVQSTTHEVWARKYSGSLETRLRYSPSDCFGTFPFPKGLWQTTIPALVDVGERYHEYRRTLMLRLWLGLTDIYNLFHNRDLNPAIVAKVSKKPDEAEAGYQGILELRKFHRELDQAVLAAYGWTDLNLGHDFVEVETLPENDRVRYTISPDARKELLKRLLALNHQRAEEEKTKAPVKAAKTGKRGRKKKVDDALGELFDFDYAATPQRIDSTPPHIEPTRLPDAAWTRPLTDNNNEIMAILAAVLKATRVPTPARQVRLAAILASEPRLLVSSLSAEEATLWKRLVGKEAEPLPGEVATFTPHSDRAWGNAVRHLRSRGMLIEDLASETWTPGMGLESFFTEGWPDGRAQMVLDILNRRNPEKLVSQLPEAIRRWVDEKAA